VSVHIFVLFSVCQVRVSSCVPVCCGLQSVLLTGMLSCLSVNDSVHIVTLAVLYLVHLVCVVGRAMCSHVCR